MYRAYINKENVLAYFTGRSEEEIVADYKNLQDIKLIEEIKPAGEIVVVE